MTMTQDSRAGLAYESPSAEQADLEDRFEGFNPFAETETPVAGDPRADAAPRVSGFIPWTESQTPFAETLEASSETVGGSMLAEALAELRDEAFDEAVAGLVDETEQVLGERFAHETASNAPERAQLAQAHLAPLQFEAQRYLEALEQGLAGVDLPSLSEQQLDEMLDRLDPEIGEVSPASEQFIGRLVRKAKSVVKFVANAAKSVGSVVLGPILRRLKALVAPLLRRVLSFAIGRLPASLQPVARSLANRLLSEAEVSEAEESEDRLDEVEATSATLALDPTAVAESFDLALAEAIAADPQALAEAEAFGADNEMEQTEDRALEMLAEARATLIDRIANAQDGEDLAPAVEQFVPALLTALRLGINVIGRPRVVGFLARYIGQVIGRWVGPQLRDPLARAITDAGLRLFTLETTETTETAETPERADEAVPAMLAATIEDTVRRFAEQAEEHDLEEAELTQLALSEAFSRAVATNFPARFVQPGIQQAPTLGGSFITRRPRSLRAYRKYSVAPQVDLTAQLANALPSFGGVSVGAVLAAAGVTFPLRVRVHIYEAAAGTTLPRVARVDRTLRQGAAGSVLVRLHPLTREAAGMLLREPALGVPVSSRYLRTQHRVAVGQRFYYLEPLDRAGIAMVSAPAGSTAFRGGTVRSSGVGAVVGAPTQGWVVVDLRRGQVRVGLFITEHEAQRISAAIRQGRGGPALLAALSSALTGVQRSLGTPDGRVRLVREGEDREDLIGGSLRRLPVYAIRRLRRRTRAWVMPALARWVRTNGGEFARATAHPESGVTVRIVLQGVPGLDVLASALAGRLTLSALRGAWRSTSRAIPTATISAVPGMRRP